jgi:hypothetical protein
MLAFSYADPAAADAATAPPGPHDDVSGAVPFAANPR